MEALSVILGLLGGGLGLLGGLCALIVPLAILGGVGVLLYRRSKQANAAKAAAQAWPHTKGIVVQSAVHRDTSGESTSTYPVVVYQYSVGGKKFQSQTIKPGDHFMTVNISGRAQATVERYPVGEQVTVYYNPENPKESALER